MDYCFMLGQGSSTESFSGLAPPMQIAIFLGAMSFVTAALVCLTAFTRIIIVLSFVRRALSTQEIPPNQVILGLSFFLTLFVMAPTMQRIDQRGIQPYLAAQESEDTASEFGLKELWGVASEEIEAFMMDHTRPSDLQLFIDLSQTPASSESDPTLESNPSSEWNTSSESVDASDPDESLSSVLFPPSLQVLIPAFIISELKTAFIMGFCIYIPFLLIDLVISTVLMSLGMMMMPPVIVSTPCKLLLFILVDGWQLISKALVGSFMVS